MQKSFLPVKGSSSNKNWYLIDAEGKNLGRLCSQIAQILNGKHSSDYSFHLDTGDYVIVTNAEKISLSGTKEESKFYFFHSGRIGGDKYKTFKEVIQKLPEYVIEHGVKGMLPKGPLGRDVYRKLKVYRGNEHPHEAQNPILIS